MGFGSTHRCGLLLSHSKWELGHVDLWKRTAISEVLEESILSGALDTYGLTSNALGVQPFLLPYGGGSLLIVGCVNWKQGR